LITFQRRVRRSSEKTYEERKNIPYATERRSPLKEQAGTRDGEASLYPKQGGGGGGRRGQTGGPIHLEIFNRSVGQERLKERSGRKGDSMLLTRIQIVFRDTKKSTKPGQNGPGRTGVQSYWTKKIQKGWREGGRGREVTNGQGTPHPSQRVRRERFNESMGRRDIKVLTPAHYIGVRKTLVKKNVEKTQERKRQTDRDALHQFDTGEPECRTKRFGGGKRAVNSILFRKKREDWK